MVNNKLIELTQGIECCLHNFQDTKILMAEMLICFESMENLRILEVTHSRMLST